MPKKRSKSKKIEYATAKNANAVAGAVVAESKSYGLSEEQTELLRSGVHLLELGNHIYPVGEDKLPIGKWRHGGKDYAVDPATLTELTAWIKAGELHGWAVISSARTGHITIDLEPEAFKDERTKKAAETLRDSVPASCVVRSRHGGFHVYLRLLEGEEMPTDTHICKRDIGIPPKPLKSGRKPDPRTLIIENRRPPNYAVPVGPGRPRLSKRFEQYVITRDEYEALVAPFKALHEVTKTETKRAENREKYEKKAKKSGVLGAKKGDTAEVVYEALRDGDLDLEAVLPEDCFYLGTSGGRELFLREDSDSESSGNMLDGVIVVWSTSLDWADPGVPMSPMYAIANHSFEGDFAAACRDLETAADLAAQGTLPSTGSVWERFPAEMLIEVHEKRSIARKEYQVKSGGELHRGAQKSIPVGEEFAAAHLDKFKYVWGIGWHEWDGRRWFKDEGTEGAVEKAGAVWAKSEITRMIEENVHDSVIKAMLRYREDGQVAAFVRSSRKETAFSSKASEMDTHAHLLNCPNGVVDLRTGELRPNDPNLLFTKVTAAEYHAGATHPDWDKALEATPGDVGDFLQIRLGQSLYGEQVPSDQIVFCRGDGENGKTAVMGTVHLAIGDFGVLIPDSVLIGKSREHPTDLMTLRGARLALIEELPEDHRLNMNRIKKITGTEMIAARLMKKDYVFFLPTHSLFITTNYDPVITETDRGSLRRIVFAEFPLTFVKKEEDLLEADDRLGDQRLKQRLRRNNGPREAALAWAVAGAVKYGGESMPPPTIAVEAATSNWLEKADVLGQWIEEELEFDPTAATPVKTLAEAFNFYAGGSVPDWSARTFNTRFKSHRTLRGHGTEHKKMRHKGLGYGTPEGAVWSWAGVRFKAHDDL